MRVQNRLDRFHLEQAVVGRIAHLGGKGAGLRQLTSDKMLAHMNYVDQRGQDTPWILYWKWYPGGKPHARLA